MITIEDSIALYQAAKYRPDNIKALNQRELKTLSLALSNVQDHMKHHKIPPNVSPLSISPRSNEVINILKSAGQVKPTANRPMRLFSTIGSFLKLYITPEELEKKVKLLEDQQQALTDQKLNEIKHVIADRQQKLLGLESIQKLFNEPTFQQMLDRINMDFKEIIESDKSGESVIVCTKKLNGLVDDLNIHLEALESHFKADGHDYVITLKTKIEEWNTLLHNSLSRNDFDETLKMINDNIISMIHKVAVDKEKTQEKIDKLHEVIKFSEQYMTALQG